jgi:hypothetical protein
MGTAGEAAINKFTIYNFPIAISGFPTRCFLDWELGTVDSKRYITPAFCNSDIRPDDNPNAL